MSVTMTVPAAVPSLFHSSMPFVPSLAVKKSVPSTFVRLLGLSRRVDVLDQQVPAAVPSLFHSSYAVRAVVGREEQRAVDVRPGSGIRAAAAGVDVLDHARCRRAVPSLFHSSTPLVPSLAAKNSVPFTSVRLRGVGAAAAGVDVLDQDGSGGGAIALPQLDAVRAVVGREEQRAVHVRQVAGARAVGDVSVVPTAVVSIVVVLIRSREDVLDQGGAGGGAVALPQLVAGCAVVGDEKNSVPFASVRPGRRSTPSADQRRCRRRCRRSSTGRPWCRRREEQRAVDVREVVGVRARPAGD